MILVTTHFVNVVILQQQPQLVHRHVNPGVVTTANCDILVNVPITPCGKCLRRRTKLKAYGHVGLFRSAHSAVGVGLVHT